MKYKSFMRIIIGVIIIAVIGGGVLITSCVSLVMRNADKPTVAATPAPISPTVPQQAVRATTTELKEKLSKWLDENPDRQGKTRKINILPNESFLATAIRFPQSDAVKWSNKDSQWSQIKIDLDRNGVDDEKWLLKNGKIYKREVLDAQGKTTFTEYVDKE